MKLWIASLVLAAMVGCSTEDVSPSVHVASSAPPAAIPPLVVVEREGGLWKPLLAGALITLGATWGFLAVSALSRRSLRPRAIGLTTDDATTGT